MLGFHSAMSLRAHMRATGWTKRRALQQLAEAGASRRWGDTLHVERVRCAVPLCRWNHSRFHARLDCAASTGSVDQSSGGLVRELGRERR